MRVRSQVRATIRIGVGVAADHEQHGREGGIRGDHGSRPCTACASVDEACAVIRAWLVALEKGAEP